jgi:beta-glucosidase
MRSFVSRPIRYGLPLIVATSITGCTSAEKSETGPVQTCDALSTEAHLDCTTADAQSALNTLSLMSLDEKVQQMSGPAYNPNNMFDQEDNSRLGIPGFKYMDGPRGVRWYNSDYGTTVYPVAAARASTWNIELERKIGKACAREMRALGRHILLAPTINQVTHPRWGRAQETYGEDSHLLGEMGASFITGAQYDPAVPDPTDPDQAIEDTYRVQACVKHFAANNIEDTRIYVNAILDDRTLREVYLPHFKKAVDAKVSCVMTSYNRVNGSYNGYSTALVRDILKGEWGFSGYVISDWFAKGNTLSSPVAGLDVEMPFSSGTFPSQFDSAYFYGSNLITAVSDGRVDVDHVNEAALRLLYAKIHNGVIAHSVGWAPYLTKSDAAQALALESAREGIVLLKNGPTAALSDDVLPLRKSAIQKIALVGSFADKENMGDKGSSDAKVVDSELVITPTEGIEEAFAGTATTVLSKTEVAGNETALASADVLIVVAAYYYADLARSTSGEEGEWKDRVSMALPTRDLTNIANAVALKSINPALKVIVVAKSGGAVAVSDWVGGVDAFLMAWYAGMQEGTALAEILFGTVNPSGKLCQSFPQQESDLPLFDNTTTGDVAYNYYHGYRWLEKQGILPQYPFGYGLSYTTFAYSNLMVTDATIGEKENLTVSVDVQNTGSVTGSEVVQLYVGYDNTAVKTGWGRPVKELKAFTRLANIAPGATQTATLVVKASDLGYWNESAKTMSVEKMAYPLYVGPSSDSNDSNMQKTTFTIE